MNKYIRKCLLIYVSMAIILCGMVGVTYAITATDADQYVTRSQYAVDMAYLQNQLDEAEAGLMGNINRYRSTDIKFTTFDTPNKYKTSTIYAGYHNGGNFFPRKVIVSNGDHYMYGHYAKQYNRITSNRTNDLVIYRLWNGNYFVSPSFAGKESKSDDTIVEYVGHAMCAVPVEDLPGWYFVMGYYRNRAAAASMTASLVKLDPNAPYPSNVEIQQIKSAEHTIRFKKDLWQYNSVETETSRAFTTTPISRDTGTSYNPAANYLHPLSAQHLSNWSFTVSETISWKGWLDPNTGDYMMTFKNIRPVHNYYDDPVYYHQGDSWLPCRFIPKDNVEYMMGPTGYLSIGGSARSSFSRNVPHARSIGMPTEQYQIGWTYEFVDGVNGIKYWHAKYTPTKVDPRNSYNVAINYSLPIVY